MNIGVFGHSLCMYNDNDTDHFIHFIRNHFDANIVQTGVVQCSEERILYDIKKQKKLDLAIVFHSKPFYKFIPSWSRDVSTVDRNSLINKITIEDFLKNEVGVSNNDLEEFTTKFSQIPNGSIFQLLEHFDIEEAEEPFLTGDMKTVKQLILKYANNEESFFNNLFDALYLEKKFLSTPELEMNRYYGAMIQIDSYLKYKNIKCVHFVNDSKWFPIWHKFISGPVNNTILNIIKEDSEYYTSKTFNKVNKQGNQLIFNTIIEMLNINAASSIEANASEDHSEEGGSIPPAAPVKDL